MKLSVNWLLELVNFNGSVNDLEDLLTRAGCKVESVETRAVTLEDVVVAEILESVSHPNADRLSVCKIADGTSQARQIVCGAKNYRVGDKVPLALPGAILPGNFKIKVGKLRGVESQGMLCSAKELALAEDAEGLLILPKEAVVGTPLSSMFPPDSILDLEITPNRGDWLSHLGIAREVATFTGEHLKWKQPGVLCQESIHPSVARIEDSKGCSAYSLRSIRGVQIAESPAWLRSKLETIGLRSVNNVVDITNYVMFLLGQPLHAFDANRVQGGIIVRSARETEEFRALDGKNYPLTAGDIVIADSQRVLALAGIMGGADSGISATTTDILLESAVFEPTQIRRTSRRTELSSDSSYRFERGIDASMMLVASELATQLICEVAGGTAEASVVVAGEVRPPPPIQVPIRFNRINRLLGLNLDDAAIRSALERVGLIQSSQESSLWKIPSFRRDLTREVDLIEEVARLIGIEAIPERRSAEASSASKADAALDFRTTLNHRLIAQGFFEARTSTLVSGNLFCDFIAESKAIRLKNPLGEEQAFLRPALIPGLLSAVQRNLNYGQRTVRLYEIGKVFRTNGDEEIPSLGIVMTGISTLPSWRSKEARLLDIYDLKGVIQALAAQPISFVSTLEQAPALVLPPGSLCLHILTKSGQFLGVAGQLAPARSRDLGVPGALLVAELYLQPLQIFGEKSFSEIPRYPAVNRDIAIVLPKSVPYESISSTLLSAGESSLISITPFDIFSDPTGEKLPADRKSVAVSLVFRSPERTLTNEEVAVVEERLKQQLVAKLGAEFRE